MEGDGLAGGRVKVLGDHRRSSSARATCCWVHSALYSPSWQLFTCCVLFPQGEDPATDIRGAGRLGLECLLYLATESGPTWDRLLGKLDGERSDWEYPFAVAGINITFMLLEVIGLQQGSSGRGQGSDPARSAAGRGFAGLTAADDRAFEELFVATFEILDREWLRQRASYMQFNTVIKAVRGRVVQALGSQPKSINELRQQMLGGRQ